MAAGKAENFRVHDEEEFFGAAAKRVVSGAMALSANEIDDDASIGDMLGAASITAAYVGTPVWSLLDDGHGTFSIHSVTGVVSVAAALTAGSTSIRIKVKGVQPPIQTTTFAVTISESGSAGIPAWAATLRDLVSNPADFLFGYNFASGGTGEGWNNVTQELLTVEQSLAAPPTFGTWSTSFIIDGLGLSANDENFGETLPGVLPPSVSAGATVFMEARTYAPVTTDTGALLRLHVIDAADTFDGGLNIRFRGGLDQHDLELEDGGGHIVATDIATPKGTLVRAASNYVVDESDLAGSINGRAVVSGPAELVVEVPPTAVWVGNKSNTDVPVYVTIIAVFALQSAVALPAISDLP